MKRYLLKMKLYLRRLQNKMNMNSRNYDADGNFLGGAYEFKWIENIGTEIIKQVSILFFDHA